MTTASSTKRITLNRFLVEQQRSHPGASGNFTRFMERIGTAAKIIASHMRHAPLEGLTGTTGTENVQGETVKQLDELGNRIFVEAFEYVDVVGMLVSEEMSEARLLEAEDQVSSYVVMVDPVDGSSNIGVNGIIGSIFAVHDIVDGEPLEKSLLQRGSEQVAAGYVMYGPSTELVYTAGDGVHSFVLDHEIGEFILHRQNLKMPAKGNTFCANVGRQKLWPEGVKRFLSELCEPESGPYSLRYSGCLLADLHQILHRGGIYFYPEEEGRPDGKLRLLYECAPLAMLAEQAGGAATSGTTRIVDIEPRSLHQRTPFAVGSANEIELYLRYRAEESRP